MSFRIIALLPLFFVSLCFAHGEKKHNIEPVILAPGYTELTYTAPEAGTYDLPVIAAAEDSHFIDSHGMQGTLHQAMRDRVTVLSFIYTKCPDVNGCPLATFVMGQLAKKLQIEPNVKDSVKFLSYSFDMPNDTPKVLKKYAESFQPFGSDWSFVRPLDENELSTTLRAYNQSIQFSEGHTFSHVLRVILVDRRLQVRNIYSTGFLHSDTILSDIRTLLNETYSELPSDKNLSTHTEHLPTPIPTSASYLGLPNHVPKAEMNNASVTLGRELFFDRSLSHNNTISCAMCHVPNQGFTSNELATAVGVEGRTVKRNAPSLLNVSFLNRLFYDLRESKLEQQIWSPLLARNEMANPSVGFVIEKIKSNPEYRKSFNQIFDQGITMSTIGMALADYQRSLIAGNSSFDRYWFGNEKNALTTSQIEGLELFRGKGNCVSCHQIRKKYALFTDEKPHNTGIGFTNKNNAGKGRMIRAHLAEGVSVTYDTTYIELSAEPTPIDLGRYEVTQNPKDRWKFRTPSLRNVALTAPYMHNGSLATLEEVVDFYDKAENTNGLLDPLIKPLKLSDNEKKSLIAFLQSLTSPNVDGLVKTSETK
jgi:cytochrome c peroxidase